MRIALGLEYDGSAFSGWQTQANGRGVQDVVEAALAQMAGHRVATICAGRTDAGVHARAQVVHFDTDTKRPDQAWIRGVNAHLPQTVAVCWSRLMDLTFHARFSAHARRYDYWIYNAPVRPALLCHRVGWVFRPLNIDAMCEGAQALVGVHDFSSFRSSQCQAATASREVQRLEIERFGQLVRIRIQANAFLHHMVRNIVAVLVDVGSGRQAPEWVGQVLRAKDRTVASATFAADGLYLSAVHYDQAFGLPSVIPDLSLAPFFNGGH